MSIGRGYNVTSEKERCRMPSALPVNTEQSATMNGDSSDSGDLRLSLSFSVSSVQIEALEVLEVESCLESYLR